MRRLVLFHSWPPKDSFAPLCSLFPSCFAAGHRPSEARAGAATQRDGRSHIIDWTLDKRSWGPSSAVGSSTVRKSLLHPAPHTHTRTNARAHERTHTPVQAHATLSPASATWGISKARKQANHPFLCSLLFSTHTTAPEWLTNVRMACMGFLRKLFIN